jgi:hypothetical protein
MATPIATVDAQVTHAIEFLEHKDHAALRILRLQYSLEVEAYLESQTLRINCYGDRDAAVLVQGIKQQLVVPDNWSVEIC